MHIIGKPEVSVVSSAKTGKDVQVLQECYEVYKHLLVAGTIKFLHHVLF